MTKLRIAIVAAAVPAAAFLLGLLPLPERSIALPHPGAPAQTAAGAVHIHSNRSDGSGSPDEIADAAARAGLRFIILTDHGDGTRAPDPPRYRSGVLVIDAVELSTAAGHYIAIGLPQTPYPLRGEPRDVIEDVRRFGGVGVVAHPDSPKPGLRWRDWDAPFDAMEWLNADSEWRNEGPARLVRALIQYPFRPVETLGSLLDRPDATLGRWDALAQRRRVVALAGADAHARAGWMDDDAEGYRRGWFLRLPSYEVSFRTFAVHVAIARPLRNDAVGDAQQIVAAIKAGRVFTAIDAVASPATLEFSAAAGNRVASQGDILDTSGPVLFTVRSRVPSGGVITILKDGRILTQHPLPELTFESNAGNGTYRVEIHLANAPGDPPVPWIVSNPIYVHRAEWETPPAVIDAAATDTNGIQGGPWHVENDGGSTARFSHTEPPKGPVEFSYRLAGGARTGQYAALAISVGSALASRTRLAFRAHASQPLRISVQARRPHSGERWQRSVYLDTEPRDVVVLFSEMRPVDGALTRFDPRLSDTVLFVADTTNTLPGAAATFSISDLRLER